MTSSPGLLHEVVGLVESGPPSLGGTRLVCVDGPAGSGKTTLAGALAGSLSRRGWSTAVLHMDDFYEGWAGLRVDLEPRLLRQVFEPLARGESTWWQRYDWDAGRFANWIFLEPPEVLLVEGCGSGARAYATYRAVLVWVEAARDTRMERGLLRDGRQAETNWRAWMDLEEAHFARNSTRECADVTVSTEQALPGP